MAKKTVQDLILQKIDNLEVKLDQLSTEKIPSLLVDMAELATKVKEEAKADMAVESRTTKMIAAAGGVATLVVSATAVAIAYFK